MPSPDPVFRLVNGWWRLRKQRPVRYHDVPAARVALCQAAIEQIRTTPGYNPFADYRVHWAAQFLNHTEDPGFAVHQDVEAIARMIFEPPVLCGKDHAAGN